MHVHTLTWVMMLHAMDKIVSMWVLLHVSFVCAAILCETELISRWMLHTPRKMFFDVGVFPLPWWCFLCHLRRNQIAKNTLTSQGREGKEWSGLRPSPRSSFCVTSKHLITNQDNHPPPTVAAYRKVAENDGFLARLEKRLDRAAVPVEIFTSTFLRQLRSVRFQDFVTNLGKRAHVRQ